MWGMPFGVALALFAPDLIEFVYGEEWEPAVGLIQAFGLEIDTLVAPRHDPVSDATGKTYNVFHVPDAVGSPVIPAQSDFVVPYGVRSVLGFGGALRGGEVAAMILFSRAKIPADSANRFRNIALDMKAILYEYGDGRIFDVV